MDTEFLAWADKLTAHSKRTKSVAKNFPTFDGHFWVERDGEIIDPYFKDYDFIKQMNGCKGKQIHLPATAMIQQVFIKKFKAVEDNLGISDSDYTHMFGEPRPFCCYQNCRLEIILRGGNLVFGSMGWAKKSGGIHYEFGGDGWTVSQFLKK